MFSLTQIHLQDLQLQTCQATALPATPWNPCPGKRLPSPPRGDVLLFAAQGSSSLPLLNKHHFLEGAYASQTNAFRVSEQTFKSWHAPRVCGADVGWDAQIPRNHVPDYVPNFVDPNLKTGASKYHFQIRVPNIKQRNPALPS